MTGRPTVAVVGAGVSGLTAAYLLQRRYDVLLFEADDRLGGHAHTHDVLTSDGRRLAVDSGFIVHNRRTYPSLLRLFGELGVATQRSEMSMSVRCAGCGLEYAGGRGARGLIAQPANLAHAWYWRMLADLPRFHRMARRLLDDEPAGQHGVEEPTLGEFLAAGRFSPRFVDHLVLPLVSAVWSADLTASADYPARYLFAFLRNHGMLSIAGAPPWYTVVGGSARYVTRAARRLTSVRRSTPVRSVRRHDDGVLVRDAADREQRVDRVVIATHADQALRLLADATDDERAVLGAFRYSSNDAWLHRDATVLPTSRGALASWNYHKPECHSTPDRVLVSYDLSRLMRLAGPDRYLVTLNAVDAVDPATVLAKMVYEHPIYTQQSVAAQRLLPSLTTQTTAFAGAYHGWGFHEDGCASGVRAASAFGVDW